MLYINKITCAAAVGAAPFVLLGCQEPSADQRARNQHLNGLLDENGADPQNDPDSTVALKAALGTCLYENYCDRQGRCTPDDGKSIRKDVQYIEKAFQATRKEVIHALGGGPEGRKQADDILGSWKTGQPVPDAALEAIDNICKGTLREDAPHWGVNDRAKAKAIVQTPALLALEKATKGALGQAGLDTSKMATQKAFEFVYNELGPKLADEALRRWRHGDRLPPQAVKALEKYIKMMQHQKHSQNSQQHSQNSQQHNQNNGMRSGSSYGEYM